jgi:cytidylate kinase
MRITVTLARQFGCGGSFLGQGLAERLGVRCLDREIVSGAARSLALGEAEVAGQEECRAPFWERMLRGIAACPPEALYHPPVPPAVSDRELLEAETAVMQEIAARESCVIVGRVAAHVLPAHAGTTNVFLHAPLGFRVPRVMAHYGAADEAQARAMIARSDETRGRFIRQMIGREWEDARNYHLCVDTSLLPLPEIADRLADFVRRRAGEG